MNDSEQRLHDELTRRGFVVHRRGWPDFLVHTPDLKRGFALELKMQGDKLSPAQVAMHDALARFGLMTYVAKDSFLRALAKRGRELLFPETLESLKKRLEETQREAEQLRLDLARLERTLADATVMFLPPSKEQQALRDAALLFDHDRDGKGAAERYQVREQARWMEEAARNHPISAVLKEALSQPNQDAAKPSGTVPQEYEL